MTGLVLDIDRCGIELWPSELRIGDRIVIAFRASRVVGAMNAPRYEVAILDSRRRRLATLLRGSARPSAGVVCVEWDGRDDYGRLVATGPYQALVTTAGSRVRLERTLWVAEDLARPVCRQASGLPATGRSRLARGLATT